MARLQVIFGLLLTVLCTGAVAASCTLDTSTATKTKSSLVCLQKRIAKLESVKTLGTPVTYYDDDFVRIDLIGKSRLSGPVIQLAVRIKNKTAAPLRIAVSGDAELFDDQGVSNLVYPLSGINQMNFASSSIDGYSLIAAKKTRTLSLKFSSTFGAKFTGSFFDLNIDFFRFDEDTTTATHFSAPFTDIPVP